MTGNTGQPEPSRGGVLQSQAIPRPTGTTTDLEMHAVPVLQSGPQGSDSTSESSHYEAECIPQDDLSMYPNGWPKLAAEQNVLFNGSFHRRFGYLFQRVLYSLETKVALLEEELLQIDKLDEERHPQRLKTAHSSQHDNMAYEGQREKDVVLEEIINQIKRYATLLSLDKDLRALPRVSRSEHHNLWSSIKGDGNGEEVLDQNGRLFLSKREDFISTKSERSNYPLDWLIYGRLGPKLTKLLEDKEKIGNHKIYLRITPLKRLLKISIVFLSGSLLLTPVLILYLAMPTKPLSAVIVLIFTFLFSAAMSLVPAVKVDTILVGLSAYMAVLVSFLSNLAGGRGGNFGN